MSADTVNPSTRIKLAIVDSHPTVRAGLQALLSNVADITIVANESRAPEVLVQTTNIDVAILGLGLPDGKSVKIAVKMLRSTGAAVIAYAGADSSDVLREARAAGAVRVVQKSESIDRLVHVVRESAQGFGLDGADWSVALGQDSQIADANLTERERQVLALYASGEQAETVAELLFISRDTVVEHVKRIRAKYRKSGRSAPTKVHLHQRAIEDGIL